MTPRTSILATILLLLGSGAALANPSDPSADASLPLAVGVRPDVNLAAAAEVTTSFVSHHESIGALNDGFQPASSTDRSHGIYGNWPQRGEQWVQYEWSKPITTKGSSVYWYRDNQGIRLPTKARLTYRSGDDWVEAPAAMGTEDNKENSVSHPAITTDALRLYFTGRDEFSTGVIEWRVIDEGSSPAFAPKVEAGPDRVVVRGGTTYLRAEVQGTGQHPITGRWSQVSGPGQASFDRPQDIDASARFDQVGKYRMRYTASAGDAAAHDDLSVTVLPDFAAASLQPIQTHRYQVSSVFWRPRLRNAILNWLPHVIAKCEDPNVAEGGLNNLHDAAAKLQGQKHGYHRGYVFSNAWVLNTFESMCLAQMIDPGDDQELAEAQSNLRDKIAEWLPLLLAAQEPDGYFQTRFTLGFSADDHPNRFDPRHRTDHEGYIAGYFLDAAGAHYLMTGGDDRRLYDAAKRLADCWAAAIGPNKGQQPWWDEHEGMELALFRFARLVDEVEGPGSGEHYRSLAKFLMDCRGVHGAGGTYDQAHVPVTHQYEAVGHAVRAVYLYTGMAEAARYFDDPAYQSSVLSLYDNMTHRKLYVTGGVGSGETAEGFGEDFSLPHNAYCESCSGVGHMFFQHRMNLLTSQAKHADLLELTLYNAVLSDLDLDGQNFTYTNPLATSDKRYKWHVCPCCVGNIPRAIFMLPTWAYSVSRDQVFTNLYFGGAVTLPSVNGTPLEIQQQTDYPTSGKIRLIVRPQSANDFSLSLRIPDRSVSDLYTSTPSVKGYSSLRVNGEEVAAEAKNGYATVTRTWSPGDTVDLELPMPIQRIHSLERVAANRGKVALQRGPLVYSLESVDQELSSPLSTSSQLTSRFAPDLLGGVTTIAGVLSDGKPFIAIPNYARNNRGGYSTVWIDEAK